MKSQLPITIVGGGLAGLTLGIALRRCQVPVTILEAGTYPRHRVCGEFICGDGIEVLRDLGLLEKFTRAGAVEAQNAAFYSGHRSYPRKALPRPALCLSRYVMDDLLANEFRQLGGQLRQLERATATGPSLASCVRRDGGFTRARARRSGLA